MGKALGGTQKGETGVQKSQPANTGYFRYNVITLGGGGGGCQSMTVDEYFRISLSKQVNQGIHSPDCEMF